MKVTLCGSLRFEEEFHYWNERLSLLGNIVYSVVVYPSYKGKKDWYTKEQKETLDLIHLAKIDNSDAIFVIDRSRKSDEIYTGESTERELEWAKMKDKKIDFASTRLWYEEKCGLRNKSDDRQ